MNDFVEGLKWEELMDLRDSLNAEIQQRCYKAGFENTKNWVKK